MGGNYLTGCGVEARAFGNKIQKIHRCEEFQLKYPLKSLQDKTSEQEVLVE